MSVFRAWRAVIFMALLLMALAPMTAQAIVFLASEVPATVSGEELAEGEALTFVLDGQKVTCESSFSATLTGETGEETLALAPTLKECMAGAVKATVEVNECEFILNGGEEAEEVGEQEFTGTGDISCPGEEVVHFKAGTCEAEIGTQSGLSEIAYTNILSESEPSSFEATAEIAGMKYKTTDGFLCPFSGSGEKSNGEITGQGLFTGDNGESAAVSVQLAPAWIDPLVLKYTAANQTQIGYWKTKTPGEYKFWGQEIKNGLEFAWVEKAGTTTCTGVFTVNKDEVKACQFKIKTTNMAAKGALSEVITVYSPKGATLGTPLKSWTEWPK